MLLDRPTRRIPTPFCHQSLGAAAERLDLPAHMLRFWGTQLAELRPLILEGGRRYSSRADLELLAGIKVLPREQRLTIAGARQVLDRHSTARVARPRHRRP